MAEIFQYMEILCGNNAKVTQRGGWYIQVFGKIFLGDYVQITQNCIISRNHKLTDQEEYIDYETIIGNYYWIACNSLIMAWVILRPRAVVADSVVKKSFQKDST